MMNIFRTEDWRISLMLEAKTMAFTPKILEYIKFVLIMKAFLTGGKFSFS